MKKGLVFLTTFILFASMLQTVAFEEVYEKFIPKFEYSQDLLDLL